MSRSVYIVERTRAVDAGRYRHTAMQHRCSVACLVRHPNRLLNLTMVVQWAVTFEAHVQRFGSVIASHPGIPRTDLRLPQTHVYSNAD